VSDDINVGLVLLTSQLYSPDPPGTLPLLAGPWNAGFPGIGWDIEDFTQCEVQQRERMAVLNYSKVPLQGSCSQVQCPRRVCHVDLFAILRLSSRRGWRGFFLREPLLLISRCDAIDLGFLLLMCLRQALFGSIDA